MLSCLLAQLLLLGAAAYRGKVQAYEGYGATGNASLREQQLKEFGTGGVWDAIHSEMNLSPDERVQKHTFVEFFKERNKVKIGGYAIGYQTYLESVFDAATAMMLPRMKVDLGKHCLTYAALLADPDVFLKPAKLGAGGEEWTEFEAEGSDRSAFQLAFVKKHSPLFDFEESYRTYLGQLFDLGCAMLPPQPTLDLQRFNLVRQLTGEFYFPTPKAADALQGISFPYDKDFDKVVKDQEGRVSRQAFVRMFRALYTNQLPTLSFQQAFEEHLNTAFDAGLSMMKPAVKTTLGRHCFKYAALMAREFYFPSVKGRDELGLV